MSTSDYIQLMQIVLTIVTLGIAYRELTRWRNELLGGKQLEILIEFGKSGIRVRNAFKQARMPIHRHRVPKSADSADVTQTEQQYQDTAHEFKERLNGIIKEIHHMKELQLDIELLFDTTIYEAVVQKYQDKYTKLQTAMFILLNHHEIKDQQQANERFNTAHSLVYGTDDGKFDEEIHQITEELLRTIKKQIDIKQ